MNARNPKGPVGVKSPGRRALNLDCAAFDVRLDPRLKADARWRWLTANAQRLTAKVNTLPPHARALRALAKQSANMAIEAAKKYQGELIERLDAEQAAKRRQALVSL